LSHQNYESRVSNSTLQILDILDELNQKATFFVLGTDANKHPDLIREICARGHDLGSHSYEHKLLYTQTKKDVRNDILKGIRILEDCVGRKIISYRAPGFSICDINLFVFDILIEAGINIDSSIFCGAHDFGGVKTIDMMNPAYMTTPNGFQILEFPVSYARIFGQKVNYSGGGYFRLMPYLLINHLMKNSEYNMTYFHPRDFDHHQPLMENLSHLRRFKSYVGLRGSIRKLRKILENFNFLTLSQAADLIRDSP
jgi:polysaccharide deacetylase family protein (PEP-CTERM system associated)